MTGCTQSVEGTGNWTLGGVTSLLKFVGREMATSRGELAYPGRGPARGSGHSG